MLKKVTKILPLIEHRHSRGFTSVGLRSTVDTNIDPFLNIDLFNMSAPTFPPHPHAGFSAVTYMLPESEGSFQNRDSFGDKSPIKPGDIHWTQAGSGMMHEEVPLVSGINCRGFQIFVNLSEKNKNLPPKAFHATASSLPLIKNANSSLTVVSGQTGQLTSPLRELATNVTILDVTINANSNFLLDLDDEKNWFLFVISGEALFAEKPISTNQAVLLSKAGQQIQLNANESGFRALICGGCPIGETVVWGGPFAMTSQEDIERAYLRYRNGEMGRLAPSF